MTPGGSECQSGQESRGFSGKRRINLHNCGSNRRETGELGNSAPYSAMRNSAPEGHSWIS